MNVTPPRGLFAAPEARTAREQPVPDVTSTARERSAQADNETPRPWRSGDPEPTGWTVVPQTREELITEGMGQPLSHLVGRVVDLEQQFLSLNERLSA